MSDKNHSSANINVNKKQNKKKKNNKVKNSDLEQTTRIRIDHERLEDSDSLDTSFLEGRLEKQFRNNKKARERLLHNSNKTFHFPLKQLLLIVLIGIIIASIIIYLPSMKFSTSSRAKKDLKVEEKKVEEKSKVIDDNYLFIGDFHTEELNLEDVSYPYVKICDKEFELKDILDDMNHRIYQYNPSVIILELGINDLDKETDDEEILNNIKEIIAGVKDNRPYADIYIESIYPINKDKEEFDEDFFENENISNDDIIHINKEIKKLVKEENISYIDIFQQLSDKKQLKDIYTDDGIHLNEKGYQKVLSYVNTVIGVKDEKASSK